MIRVGRVTNSEIKKNQDGDTDVRILTVEISDSEDIQTCEYYDDGGRDYRPPDNAEVVILDINPSNRIVVGVDDLLVPSVEKGELEHYSTDTGGSAKAATVKHTNAGQLELNGTGDFAVRFTALETKLAELESNLNALVDDYNGHQHQYNPSGSGTPADTTGAISPGSQPSGATSSVDFTPARVDTIEVPS